MGRDDRRQPVAFRRRRRTSPPAYSRPVAGSRDGNGDGADGKPDRTIPRFLRAAFRYGQPHPEWLFYVAGCLGYGVRLLYVMARRLGCEGVAEPPGDLSPRFMTDYLDAEDADRPQELHDRKELGAFASLFRRGGR